MWLYTADTMKTSDSAEKLQTIMNKFGIMHMTGIWGYMNKSQESTFGKVR